MNKILKEKIEQVLQDEELSKKVIKMTEWSNTEPIMFMLCEIYGLLSDWYRHDLNRDKY
jgi:hypothetical protein